MKGRKKEVWRWMAEGMENVGEEGGRKKKEGCEGRQERGGKKKYREGEEKDE